MKSYGSCSTAIPDTRHVPIPTTPVTREGSDIVSRLEAKAAWRSPIVLRDTDPEVWRAPVIEVRPRTSVVDGMPIVQRYADGMTMDAIARELRHSPQTVRRALADHGVTIRPRGGGGKRRPTRSLTLDVQVRVIGLIERGATLRQAAEEAGISKTSAGNVWRAWLAETVGAQGDTGRNERAKEGQMWEDVSAQNRAAPAGNRGLATTTKEES